jgi:hypothetical protein
VVSDPIPGLADPVAVVGSSGAATCEFAFVPAAYTAVRAWLESSPPGYKANVA